MTFLTCNRGGPKEGARPFLRDDEPFPDLCQWSFYEDQIELEGIIQENHLRFAPDVVGYFTNAMLHGDGTIDTAYVLEEYMNTGEEGLPLFFDINDPEMVDTKVRGLIFLISLLPVYHLN